MTLQLLNPPARVIYLLSFRTRQSLNSSVDILFRHDDRIPTLLTFSLESFQLATRHVSPPRTSAVTVAWGA